MKCFPLASSSEQSLRRTERQFVADLLKGRLVHEAPQQITESGSQSFPHVLQCSHPCYGTVSVGKLSTEDGEQFWWNLLFSNPQL